MGKFSNRFEDHAEAPLEFSAPELAPPGVPEEAPLAEIVAAEPAPEIERYVVVEQRLMGNGKLEPFEVVKRRPKGSA
ncbi:MAG: hypothetical protein ACH36H_13105 [Candidatus Nanopelagicales bacterium]